jgi:hypothetical protein
MFVTMHPDFHESACLFAVKTAEKARRIFSPHPKNRLLCIDQE